TDGPPAVGAFCSARASGGAPMETVQARVSSDQARARLVRRTRRTHNANATRIARRPPATAGKYRLRRWDDVAGAMRSVRGRSGRSRGRRGGWLQSKAAEAAAAG